MIRFRQFVILLLLVLSPNTCFSQSDNSILYLGVIENKEDRSVQNNNDSASFIQTLRPLFYKKDTSWLSLEDSIGNKDLYPQSIVWHVAFDGRYFGHFTSRMTKIRHPESKWTYARDTYHSVGNQKLPVFGEKNRDFGGFPYYLCTRPLIAVSDSNYHDPEVWKVSYPSPSDTKGLRILYKTYVNSIEDSYIDSLKNISVLKSYKTANGDWLIQLANHYQMEDEIFYEKHVWFYRSTEGTTINLSEKIDAPFQEDEFTDDDISNARLVDIGDYDGNGQNEFVFWCPRYNGDGYVMLYSNFNKLVRFDWNYH